MTASPNAHTVANWTSPQVVSIGITGLLALPRLWGWEFISPPTWMAKLGAYIRYAETQTHILPYLTNLNLVSFCDYPEYKIF